MSRDGPAPFPLLFVALVVLLLAPGAVAPPQQGVGSLRIKSFVEITATDASMAPLSAAPTSSDPGPRAHDPNDGFTFNTGNTNTRHLVLIDVSSATATSDGASTRTVQGATHAIKDWVHLRQDATTVYGTVEAIGVFDAAAGSYIAPQGFTKDSQGTLALRTYSTSSPADGGTPTTVRWIYDAGLDTYWFDAGDSDFTDGDGETKVFPTSHHAEAKYTFAVSGLTYGVASVAGAGSQYVPTVRLAWNDLPGPAGGNDFDLYVLIDFPSGTPTDGHAVTVRASIRSTK